MNSSFRSKIRDQRGFTLLEVLITMGILVFLSLGIYQAMVETFRLRDILSNEGDFYNTIRLAMGIVERDVNMMYSPVTIMPKKKTTSTSTPSTGNGPAALQQRRAQTNQPETTESDGPPISTELQSEFAQTTTYWAPALDKTGTRPSRFIGTDKKFSFVSSSYIRLYRDARESEFAKISYEFKRDEEPEINGFKAEGSSVLVKTESSNVFDTDDTKDRNFSHAYPLLRGITKFKIEYYDKKKEQWQLSWDSDTTDPKNLYPDMIRITLEVQGPSRLSFDGIYRFRPEVPFNGLPATL